MEATIKPVPGFTSYGISDAGVAYGQRGQPLNLFRTAGGYLRFSPCVDGKLYHMFAHRAVALAFIGDPPDENRIYVGHRNGIPGDNRLENVRWVTFEENWEDRRRHGNHGRGSQNGRAKMTQEKADQLRELYATGGFTYQQLADRFGISQAQSHKIGVGLYWPASS